MDVLIGMNKVKFTTLKELNWIPKTTKKNDSVSLFIDLPTILSRLYIKNNLPDIINYSGDQVMAIVSGVLNVVAHYRRFLYGNGYDNTIYLIFNQKIPTYQSRIMTYGHQHFDRYSKSNQDYVVLYAMIDKAMGILHELVDHIPGVYFPDTSGIEDYVAVYHLEDPEDKTLIIGKYEEYHLLFPYVDATILHPKKDPIVIRRDNVIEHILSEVKYNSEYVNYQMMTNLYSIIGLKNREVECALGLKPIKTFKLFDRLLKEGIITNSVSPRQLFYAISHGVDENVVEELYARYLMIDAKSAEAAISSAQKIRIKNGIVDLYDNNRLEDINNHVSKDHIINFMDLYLNKIRRLEWS